MGTELTWTYSRKDLSDKVSDSLTPESQKSTTDQAKDSVSGAYDKVAGSVQPDSQKSTSQKAADTFSSNKDSASNESKSYLESAQETVGNLAQNISDTISGNTSTLLDCF